jgi:hypothetical protein
VSAKSGDDQLDATGLFRGLGSVRRQDLRQDCEHEMPEPAGEQAHVVTGGTEAHVDRVACAACEVVSFEKPVRLHVAEDRLDGISSAHLAPDCRRGDPAGVAKRDVEAVPGDAMAAVAPVNVSALPP